MQPSSNWPSKSLMPGTCPWQNRTQGSWNTLDRMPIPHRANVQGSQGHLLPQLHGFGLEAETERACKLHKLRTEAQFKPTSPVGGRQ